MLSIKVDYIRILVIHEGLVIIGCRPNEISIYKIYIGMIIYIYIELF